MIDLHLISTTCVITVFAAVFGVASSTGKIATFYVYHHSTTLFRSHSAFYVRNKCG